MRFDSMTNARQFFCGKSENPAEKYAGFLPPPEWKELMPLRMIFRRADDVMEITCR